MDYAQMECDQRRLDTLTYTLHIMESRATNLYKDYIISHNTCAAQTKV